MTGCRKRPARAGKTRLTDSLIRNPHCSRVVVLLLLLGLFLPVVPAFAGDEVAAPSADASDVASRQDQPDEAEQMTEVKFGADELESTDQGQVLKLKGNVRIVGQDIEFGADEATYRPDTNLVEAVGNVTMKQGEDVVSAEEGTYDLGSHTGELRDCRGEFDPWFFQTPLLRRTGPETGEAEDGHLTTCDLEKPHYRLASKKIELTDGEKVVARTPTVYLGVVPVLKLPRYTHALDGERPPLHLDTGHDSRLGYFLRSGYEIDITERASTILLADVYTDEGFGTGLEGEIKTDGGLLDFRTYITNKEKGRAEAYYTQELFENWRAILQAEQWSEKDFLEEFYYDEFKERTEPETFLNLTRTGRYSLLSATVRKRTNGFVDETERLPEVTLVLVERQIGDSRFYYSVENSLAYLEETEFNEYAFRNFTGGRLSYVATPVEWLSVVPFAGMEGTYYSSGIDDDGDDDQLYRTAPLAGVTLGTRLHKVYGSPWESVSAFKHIVVPIVTYTHRWKPTVRARDLHLFDALDGILEKDRIEFELDNVVLARTPDNVSRDVARLSLYSGIDFYNEVREDVDWAGRFDLTPWEKIGFRAEADNHDGEEDFRRYHGKLFYREGEERGHEGSVGYGYTENEAGIFKRVASYSLGTDLGEKWHVSFEHRYDIDDGDLERQEYKVWRDLHCFEAMFSYRVREESQRFYLMIGLKAFPHARLQL